MQSLFLCLFRAFLSELLNLLLSLLQYLPNLLKRLLENLVSLPTFLLRDRLKCLQLMKNVGTPRNRPQPLIWITKLAALDLANLLLNELFHVLHLPRSSTLLQENSINPENYLS